MSTGKGGRLSPAYASQVLVYVYGGGEIERKTVRGKRVERARRGRKKEGGGGELEGMWRCQESGKREKEQIEDHIEGEKEDGEGTEEEEEQQTILLMFSPQGPSYACSVSRGRAMVRI